MEPKVNYTIVGLFVVIMLIALAFIIVSLTAGHSHRDYQHYVVYMNESVSGLTEQSAVKYNGVLVGQVQTITLNTNHPEKVMILLEIDQRYPIHQGTTATIETQGLTGLSYIGLSGGQPGAALITANNGQGYPEIPSKPSLLFSLNQTVHHIVSKVDTIADSIKSLLNKHNQTQVTKILDNVAGITSTIKDNDQHIQAILQHGANTMKNLDQASHDFPAITHQAHRSLQHFEQVLNQVNNAVAKANQTITQGGSLLENFNRQIMPKLYDNLDNFADMSNSLKTLSRDLNANPAILVRGKQAVARGPGE